MITYSHVNCHVKCQMSHVISHFFSTHLCISLGFFYQTWLSLNLFLWKCRKIVYHIYAHCVLGMQLQSQSQRGFMVPFSLPPWAIRGGFQMLSYIASVLFIVYRCGKKSSKQQNHEITVASAVSILSAARFSFSSLGSRKYAAPWISSVSVACVLDDVSRNCSPGLRFPLLLYHIQIWPCSLKNLMSHFHSFFEISCMLTMYFNHILSCSSLWLLPDLPPALSDFVLFYKTALWVQSVLPVQAWM